MDKHFESRHSQFTGSLQSLCLADYCDLLDCEYYSDINDPHTLGDRACFPSEMDQLLVICHELVTECFSDRNHSLLEVIKTSTCHHLTCGYVRPSWTWTAVFMLISIAGCSVWYLLNAIDCLFFQVI